MCKALLPTNCVPKLVFLDADAPAPSGVSGVDWDSESFLNDLAAISLQYSVTLNHEK